MRPAGLGGGTGDAGGGRTVMGELVEAGHDTMRGGGRSSVRGGGPRRTAARPTHVQLNLRQRCSSSSPVRPALCGDPRTAGHARIALPGLSSWLLRRRHVGRLGGRLSPSSRREQSKPLQVRNPLPLVREHVGVVLRVPLPVGHRHEPPAQVLQLPALEQRGAGWLAPDKMRWPVYLDRDELLAAAINDQVQAVAVLEQHLMLHRPPRRCECFSHL